LLLRFAQQQHRSRPDVPCARFTRAGLRQDVFADITTVSADVLVPTTLFIELNTAIIHTGLLPYKIHNAYFASNLHVLLDGKPYKAARQIN